MERVTAKRVTPRSELDSAATSGPHSEQERLESKLHIMAKAETPAALIQIAVLVMVLSALNFLAQPGYYPAFHLIDLAAGLALLLAGLWLRLSRVPPRAAPWTFAGAMVLLVVSLLSQAWIAPEAGLGYVLIVVCLTAPLVLAWRPFLAGATVMVAATAVVTIPSSNRPVLDWTLLCASAAAASGVLLHLRLRSIRADVRAELDLAEQTQRLELVLESSRLGLWDWNMQTGEVVLDERWAEMLGYTLGELQPTTIDTEDRLTHPEDRVASDALVEEHRAGRIPYYELQVRMRHRDGHWVWVRDRGRIVEWTPEGQPLRMTGTLEDVSAAHLAAEEVLRERTRLQATLDSLIDPHVMLRAIRDETGRIVDFECTDANPAACRFVRLSRAELVGLRLLTLLPGQAASGLFDLYSQVVDTGESLALDDYLYPHEVLLKERYFDVRAVRVEDGLSYTWRDVTARHLAEKEIAESERRFRLLADNAMDMVITVSPEGVVEWCSPSVASVLGRRPEDLVGGLSMVIIHPADRELARQMAAKADRGELPTYRARFVTSTGQPKWMEVTPRALRDESGVVRGRVVSVRDVDREVIAAQALEHEIEFDSLTGLAKRGLAIDRIQEIIDTRSEPQWALLCLGVHGMTAVNQAYSYAAGDDVLRAVTDRLVGVSGARDRVARIGGDEFAILMRDIVTPADAADAAERVLAAVEGPVEVGGGGVTVEIQACVGIAVWSGLDAEALLRDATAAMRRAYAKGLGRWEILDSNIAAESRRILDVKADLRLALAEDRLQSWFMPLVDLASGQVHGYESLVRWVRPDGSVIPPDDFLPIAERSDLILQIDRVMLARTLDALMHVDVEQHVAVNISAATLRAGNLEDAVRTELARTGVAPQRLHLEVTETDLLHLTDEIDSLMRNLAGLGITWWIDDFGTGFSSISHLRDMPIQGVKLDRSFTAGITDGDDRAVRLAQGLVGLAEGLGLMTIAEGVETAEQANILQAQGWQMGQGWLFGKAAPVGTSP